MALFYDGNARYVFDTTLADQQLQGGLKHGGAIAEMVADRGARPAQRFDIGPKSLIHGAVY